MMMPGFKLMQCRDEKEKEAKKLGKSYTYCSLFQHTAILVQQFGQWDSNKEVGSSRW